MKIYVARHGQTDWNVRHLAQGRTDVPLNETGIRQAEALWEKLKDVQFTAVYASPLERAVKTAKIATGGQHEVFCDDRLIERAFGDYEGSNSDDWVAVTGYDIDDLRINIDIGGVETVTSVLERTKLFLDSIKPKFTDDEAILIVTHSQIVRGLHHNIIGYDDTLDWRSVKYSNAEVRRYKF